VEVGNSVIIICSYDLLVVNKSNYQSIIKAPCSLVDFSLSDTDPLIESHSKHFFLVLAGIKFQFVNAAVSVHLI
jgi:hypothetical protein